MGQKEINFLKLIIFILNFFGAAVSLKAKAQSQCENCDSLAEVSISNTGLSKILQMSLKEGFRTISHRAPQMESTRDFVLDKSKCKTTTLGESLKKNKVTQSTQINNSEENCFGLPDISSGDIGAGTLLRPYKAILSELKIKQFDLDLATPIECQKLSCDFKIKLKKIDLSGNLKIDYTDKNENLIPNTQLQLASTDNSEIVLSAKAFLDPQTGRLNDLVVLAENQTQIDIKPGSLDFKMNFRKNYESIDSQQKLESKHFKLQAETLYPNLNKTEYIAEQIKKYIHTQAFNAWSRSADRSLKYEKFENEVKQKLITEYGSLDSLKQKLITLSWPHLENEKAIFSMMQSKPKELVFFPEIVDRIEKAKFSALADNAGFSNIQGFQMALLGVYAANQIQDSSYLINEVVKPLIQKKILPKIESEVNEELRQLKKYWQQASSVPSLNLQNLISLNKLETLYNNSQSTSDKEAYLKKIKELKKIIDEDWLPFDTQLIVDQNTYGQKLLKLQIAGSNPQCSDFPRKFSDNSEDSFDIRTELGLPALQAYFKKMAENKKLNMCIMTDEIGTCRDGLALNLKSPPQITCQNGHLQIDFDAEAKKKLFGTDVHGQLKIEFKTCGDQPCMRLFDSHGQFKNVFINSFFGNLLDHSFASAVNSSDYKKISSAKTKLLKSSKNPTNCNYQFDWQIQ